MFFFWKGFIPNHRSRLAIQVGNCAFASDDATIRNMAREMEEIYASVFSRLHLLFGYILRSHNVLNIPARGDKEKALKRLRPMTAIKSYHFSIFRSGLLIGVAIPALIDGLLKGQYFDWYDVKGLAPWWFIVQQPKTQQAIPCWDILLFLYGLIFVPVLYSFLLGFNFMAWTRFRINYDFILGKEEKSSLFIDWNFFN